MIGLMALALAANGMHYDDGNDLLRVCADKAQAQFCLGYAAGMAAGFHLGDHVAKGHHICLPPKATNGDFQAVIVSFVTSHPTMRWQPASTLGALALMKAYPCPK